MGHIDWEDVLLHVVAAVVMMAIIGLLLRNLQVDWLIWAAAVGNAAVWFWRERRQDIVHGTSPAWPQRPSTQKWFEAVAPAVAGFVVAAVFWFFVF